MQMHIILADDWASYIYLPASLCVPEEKKHDVLFLKSSVLLTNHH